MTSLDSMASTDVGVVLQVNGRARKVRLGSPVTLLEALRETLIWSLRI